jgi:hypothetical protein
VILVGCSLLSLVMLLVFQAGMSDVCIVDAGSPVSNSTDVCTVIPINGFQLPFDVNRWIIFCSQNLHHYVGLFLRKKWALLFITPLYEGESNENLKNVINIRFPAPLFCKLAVQLPML